MANETGPELTGYFDKQHSVDIVNARMGAEMNPRLREVMTVLVRHLHAAITEADIKQDEWMKGIEFLTATGQICSDVRQEFILLSDILGVSMLVDAVTHDRPEGTTENTVQGPFYVNNAPRYANGASICLDGKGEPLLVRGRVVDESGAPVAGATIDTWQTNEEGFYDVQQKGIQPDWNLRGIFTADDKGEFWFRSVKPRYYPIPDDGPVGKLLTALGRHPNRPAHIHFLVTAEGYQDVTTHIFAPDCQYLGSDPVFGVKQSLIAEFDRVDDAAMASQLELPNPFWSVDWEFVLTKA